MPIIGDVSGLRKTTKVFPKTLYISTENLISDFGGYKKFSENIPIKGTYFKRGDTLVANIRPYLKKVFFAAFDGCASSDVLVFQPKKVFPLYFFYCLANEKFVNYIMLNAKGSKMPRGDKWWMLKKKIAIVPLEEQKKTALFLSLIDERIVVQNKIIQDIDTLRIHTITSLKTIAVFGKKQLSGLLKERIEKNKASFEICSVAVIEGVVNQIEHLGRSFSAKNTSNYKVVHYGDVVYTKSPTGLFPFGIIKQSLQINEVAVSPLYAVYKPFSFNIGLYLHFYFLSPTNTNNYLKPLVEKGAKNTMNISNQRAVSGYVPFPNDDHYLEKLCNFLVLLDRKKEKEKNLLQLFIQEKKCLLQNLFI